MKSRLFILVVLLLIGVCPPLHAGKPKLVVLIVLDQFPYTYLTRCQPYFSQNGFHYLLQKGANFTNARYEHAYTKTGPGHAALMTGSYSHLNGIVANRWYDRERHKDIGCVDDEGVQLLGAPGVGHSPRNLQAYTFGDMLRIETNFRSKTIGISNKDRSAIFMAGKLGTAFWIEDSVVVTSSYYMAEAPRWVTALNGSGKIQQYFKKEWTETNPLAAATLCDDDDAPYEESMYGLGRIFPHPIVGNDRERISPSYYSALIYTPYATEFLLDAVRTAVEAESLGVRGITDVLAIGISATDEIGHNYGPESHEVFDNILRTDEMVGQFLSYLEHRIGLQHCLVILTSDHGIAPIPEYLKKKAPVADAGRVSSKEIASAAESCLVRMFGKTPSGNTWIERVIETDIYLNRKTVSEKSVSEDNVIKVLKDSLCRKPSIAGAYSRKELEHMNTTDHFGNRLAKTFFSRRSGDLLLVLKPFYVTSSDMRGTNHGQPYDYDSHVPLIFLGKPFIPGTYRNDVSPIDLVPTLAEVLDIPPPPSYEGKVLLEALR